MKLIDKIAENIHLLYPGQSPDYNKIIATINHTLKTENVNDYIVEARDNTYASYEVKKDKVIATVSAQKAAAFTSLAKSWQALDKSVSLFEEKKRELNELKNQVAAQEEELHNKIREKVVDIFDDGEKAMTLTVECLNSSFTLSKLTETNQDKVITKAGDIISTDYQKVVELLLAQNADLKTTIDGLIKEASVIASADVVKAGAKRRLSVNVGESLTLNEGIFDRIFTTLQNFGNKIKSYLNRADKRQDQINNLIFNLK